MLLSKIRLVAVASVAFAKGRVLPTLSRLRNEGGSLVKSAKLPRTVTRAKFKLQKSFKYFLILLAKFET